MVKLYKSKSTGVSSQMGLLRFYEELSKGMKIEPQVLVLGVALVGAVLFVLSLLYSP